MNVKELGQVFTPQFVVDKMLGLINNQNTILEPSVGDGAFFKRLVNKAVGIEIDKNLISDNRVLNCDFFSYSVDNKFDTIIGNPPYVKYQDIKPNTKQLLKMEHFDFRSNLYLFFIDKCIDHLNDDGELILITPRDFMKATSANQLNKKLYNEGSMTHYYELGDSTIFKGYSPNCSIWRWVKGLKNSNMETGGTFCYGNGQLWFGKKSEGHKLGDFFEVKVGAVSGADKIFSNDNGCTKFVCSKTASSGETRRMIYNRMDDILKPYKDLLINRRIRKFNESNWWEWGRKYHQSEKERIYVNCKTRRENPFFFSDVKAYDGSILALFPKFKEDIDRAIQRLNKIDWNDLGFFCDGRFLFSQRSLENAPIDKWQ